MKGIVTSPSLSLRYLYKQSSTPIPHSYLQFSHLPYMIASLVGQTLTPKTIRTVHHQSKPMAACVDNPRNDTAKKPIYRSSDRAQMENSRCRYTEFDRRSYGNYTTCAPRSIDVDPAQVSIADHNEEEEDLWLKICDEARSDIDQEPILRNYYFAAILSHNSLERALANHLANKLSTTNLPSNVLLDIFSTVLIDDHEIRMAIWEDLKAAKERDPACMSLVHCLLNFKGFLACQAHRVAHKLWINGRKVLALLIQNRASEAFAVDIHPGAKIGHGILFDHATGVVIGETAVIGDDVSILHNVTLGGTGKVSGDRHPKIGNGVLVGAGTHILGNVMIGEGAKIGAGSVVLKEVPPRTTAVGNPARLVGGKENPVKLDKLPSFTMDHTSFINEWSDYVI
ncbi:serine acetyltransferase 1, chloroplastic-like [Magnolia sinica]|uniref:serine acetyltransferase 1, chloroplastic-like n=1 Tax=Magnolia sinica TaxID=86752 RepID=UPI00265AC179|nr:serine acetyltransferase 1, chloroplastic-like [Magnolia sinica]